jgi:glyoxylase-like metal-dependent hydrolase (beta-lactamase superfamily II)
MQISKNIYYIEGDVNQSENLYKGFASCNLTIIKGEEQILIDPGFLSEYKNKYFYKEFKKYNIDINMTNHIFFTHHHIDHIKGAKQLLKLKNKSLWMHEDSEKYLYKNTFQYASYTNFPHYIKKEIFNMSLFNIIALFSIGYHFDYFKADNLFKSNDTLKICGIKIKAIPTFGHCPGHVSYYLPYEKILIAGDLFFKKPHLSSLISNALSNYKTALYDINKLLKLDIDILISGHEKIIIGRKKIKDHLKRLESTMKNLPKQILKILNNKNQTLTQISNIIFPNPLSINKYHYLSITYNILNYLKSCKIVEATKVKNKVIWKKIN